MSYPQPNADQYAINGFQFFRLITRLVSPGDIYQSQQSGLGFALGPESDIANVNVAYFDNQAPNFLNQTVLSPERAFVGRIDSRNDTTFAPAGRPGVILFWSANLYDPAYRPIALPAAFNPAIDAIQFISPVLDVVEYFKPQDSLGPGRIDKEFSFQNYPVVTGRFYLVVPYYGRKYASINITNRDQVVALTVGVVGLNYAITQDNSAKPYHQETTIVSPTAIAANGRLLRVIKADTDGMFDALVFSFNGPGPAPLRIDVSDRTGAV